MTVDFPIPRRPNVAPAFAAIIVLALLACALTGCRTTAQHDLALAASAQNAELTEARNDEQRAFVLAADARQRVSLDRELDIATKLGEAEIELTFVAELAAATVLASPAGAESRPEGAAASRPMVAAATVADIAARQKAKRADNAAAVAAKRKEIVAQLDRELRAWLDDPKARQQARVAAALSVYARQQSEFARFVADLKAGVGLPGSKP